MQLIIKNTHIFDRKIQEEFREFIKLHKEKIDASKSYELKIIYNSDSVLDICENQFCFDNSIYNTIELKFKNQNKKDEAINMQLEQCRNVLKSYAIKCYMSWIEGHKLNNNNIKIVIEEDKSEPVYTGKGKNKVRMSATMIVPNIEYIERKMSNLYGEIAARIYSDLYESIGNKIMCKILDIQNTEDKDIIVESFIKEYGDLFFSTEDEHRKSKEKFLNRVRALIQIERKNRRGHDNV